MQNTNTTYRANAPTIVYEEIDGEAVIVNMENGSYYSLDDSGAFIWNLIEQGLGADEVVAAVDSRYSGDVQMVGRSVRELIDKLIEEDLVVAAPRPEGTAAARREQSETNPKPPFVPPVLRKYSDMEELLLLDPVHDIGEEKLGGA